MRVLLVEDNPRVARGLETALRARGYRVICAPTAAQALAAPPVDLVLLDLGLPDRDGLEVCRELRRRGDVAIIAVTARGEERDRVNGLRTGADDYIVKPFGVAELNARIDAVMRRAARGAAVSGTRQVGSLRLDVDARRVEVDGREVALTRKEFDLPGALARRPGTVVTREQLLADVWQTTWAGNPHTVEVHVASLRGKLGDPGFLQTVRGVGYRLRTEPSGPKGAVYRAIGGQLVRVLAERFPGTRVREIQTGASVDNLHLLAGGGTDLAFASLDAVVEGLASGQPADTTAISRLYDSWMHLVVPTASPLRSFTDLDGRPVASGAAGSGTRFTANRLVDLAGIRPHLVDADQTDSAALLAAGRVAAMLSLTGVPTPAITDLARRTAIRLIPLEQYAAALADRYGDSYTPAVLPSSAYPGVAATGTLTVPNLLLARPDLADDVVERIAAALFAERARIAVGHLEANRINVRSGISTGPVRLHPGALNYFRSVKP